MFRETWVDEPSAADEAASPMPTRVAEAPGRPDA